MKFPTHAYKSLFLDIVSRRLVKSREIKFVLMISEEKSKSKGVN